MSDELRARLKNCAREPVRTSAVSGKGIVTCAGGLRLFTCAYVLVRVLRETLGCRLPIQFWYFGGEELSPVMRKLLAASDVELVDATAVLDRNPANIRDGWQLKPYSILHSRFSEVLFLDADQVPVRDPASVFEMPEYQAKGAVFWPDIVDLRADNPIWELVGLPRQSCVSWESGQILVDKRRHWPSLQTALCLNEHADVIYPMIHGDKDTFLVAWRLTGAEVSVVPHRPFSDSRVLIQRDFGGVPLFQHRCGAKWSYHSEQHHLAQFSHMEACLGFLEDLRKAWNGRLFFPPDRSLAARAEEERLETIGSCHLSIPCYQEIGLELLPGHQIGAGRSVDRQNWYVTDSSIGLELIIHDSSRVTYRMHPSSNGSWLGERLAIPRSEVRLDERSIRQPTEHVAGINGLVESLVGASGLHEGDSKQARQELRLTLRLLLRAEPTARAALLDLASRSSDLAEIVRELIESYDQRKPRVVAHFQEVLETRYQSPGDADR
jgi:hypothetical protein